MGNLANLLTFEPIFSPSKMTEEKSRKISCELYLLHFLKIFPLRAKKYFFGNKQEYIPADLVHFLNNMCSWLIDIGEHWPHRCKTESQNLHSTMY